MVPPLTFVHLLKEKKNYREVQFGRILHISCILNLSILQLKFYLQCDKILFSCTSISTPPGIFNKDV